MMGEELVTKLGAYMEQSHAYKVSTRMQVETLIDILETNRIISHFEAKHVRNIFENS